MGARSRTSRWRTLIKVVVYGLAGFAVFMLFLEVWPSVAWLRYGALLAFVTVMIGWQSYAWRQQREDRHDRQTRWGLRR